MSEALSLDQKGEYISSIICQGVQEVIDNVDRKHSLLYVTEFNLLLIQYGTNAKIYALTKLFSDLLPSTSDLTLFSGKFHLLKILINNVLEDINSRSIFRNAFSNISIGDHVIKASLFFGKLDLDLFAECVCCMFLLELEKNPFGKDLVDHTKDTFCLYQENRESNLIPIYYSDIIAFINKHKTWWGDRDYPGLISKFTNARNQNLGRYLSLPMTSKDITSESSIPMTSCISLLPEVGCFLCCSEDILTQFIQGVYHSQTVHFGLPEVSEVLIKLANSETTNDLSSQIALAKDLLTEYEITLPKEIYVHCWDPKLVTTVLMKLDPLIDMKAIFILMDCESFTLTGLNALMFLYHVWITAGMNSPFPSLVNQPWSHIQAEFSFLKYLLQAPPEVFDHAEQSGLFKDFPSFPIPQGFHPFAYSDVLMSLFNLLETNLFDDVKVLLSPIVSQEPLFLLLLLLYMPSLTYMTRYFIEQLLIRTLSSPIPLDGMEALRQAIQSEKTMIVGMLELFLRTHDVVPNAMLININQLGLQELLLASKNHTVFNQLFVKNWSTDSSDSKPLEDMLCQRIDRFGATVLNSMISFITEHAADFEKASQPLFSLLRLIEQYQFNYKYIETNVVTPIKEVIEKLTSSPALKTAWDSIVQAEAEKMVSALEESTDWDLYCDDIKTLRHSPFTFDYYVYHAYLKQLYSSIQLFIERNDPDTSALMVFIKALGILIERRVLEEKEKTALKEILSIMDQAAGSPLGVLIYQSFMRFISVCLHDHTDLELQVKTNRNIQLLQRNSSMKQSPFTVGKSFTPGMSDVAPGMTFSTSIHSLSRSHSVNEGYAVPRNSNHDVFGFDLSTIPALDESKSQFIKRLMNQLGASNVDIITSKLYAELTPDCYPSFSKLFVEGYISRQEMFTQVYLDMALWKKDPYFEEVMVDVCILSVYRILKEKDDMASHQQLTRIARFLGGMTVGRDRVLSYRKMNLKKLLINSVKESRVLATIMFTCELLSCCKNSTVLKSPSQPWLHSLLVTLWVVHTDTRIVESRSQFVPNLFDSFSNSGYESLIDAIKKEAEGILATSVSLSPALSNNTFTPSTLSHSRSQSGLSSVSLPPSQSHTLQHSMSLHSSQPHINQNYPNSLLTSKSVSFSPSLVYDNEFETFLNAQTGRLFKESGMSNLVIKQICRDVWKTLKNDLLILPEQPPLKELLTQDLTEEISAAISQCCTGISRARFDSVNKLFLTSFNQHNIPLETNDFAMLVIHFFHQSLTMVVKERMMNKGNTILNSITEGNVMATPPGWTNQHMTLHDHLNQCLRGYINSFRMFFQRLYIQQTSLPKEANLIMDLQNLFLSVPFSNQTDLQTDNRFLFLVDTVQFSFFETPDTKDVHVYQILLPLVLNVNKNTVNIPTQPVFETALRSMVMKNIPISVTFLGKCLNQQYIQPSFLDTFLTKLVSSSHNAPYEQNVIDFINKIIQKLFIESDCLYTNKLPTLIRSIAESTQTIDTSSPLYSLKQSVLRLQRKYEMLVQEGVYLSHFASVFQAWYDLCQQSQYALTEDDTITFIMALKKKGLFVSETQTIVAFRLLFISALEMREKGEKDLSTARAFAILVISLIRYTDFSSKSSILLCALTSVSGVLADEFKNGNTRGNQPALQIVMDLLQHVLEPLLPCLVGSSTPVTKSDLALITELLRVYLYGIQLMQPEVLPAFSYCWITIVSNTTLIQMVKAVSDSVLEKQFKKLLVSYLRFLHHFMALEAIPDGLDCHLKTLTSFLLELRNLWPELLSKYYGDFCILIPVRYIQLHNIITSAEPAGIKQFKPYESINDEMNRCFRQPTQDFWDTTPILSHLDISNMLKAFSETNDSTILGELATLSRKHILTPEYFALLYEIPFSLFMKFGFSEKDHTFPVDYFCDLVKLLVKDNLFIPLRETLLSILDHVRYPSTDTYSYCMLMKTLMKREGRDTVITAICDRLLVPGPKSWGLHFLFVQLVNSEKDNIKELKCYKTNPAIRNLVDEYISKK